VYIATPFKRDDGEFLLCVEGRERPEKELSVGALLVRDRWRLGGSERGGEGLGVKRLFGAGARLRGLTNGR